MKQVCVAAVSASDKSVKPRHCAQSVAPLRLLHIMETSCFISPSHCPLSSQSVPHSVVTKKKGCKLTEQARDLEIELHKRLTLAHARKSLPSQLFNPPLPFRLFILSLSSPPPSLLPSPQPSQSSPACLFVQCISSIQCTLIACRCVFVCCWLCCQRALIWEHVKLRVFLGHSGSLFSVPRFAFSNSPN